MKKQCNPTITPSVTLQEYTYKINNVQEYTNYYPNSEHYFSMAAIGI
jgi:hypothetical protein